MPLVHCSMQLGATDANGAGLCRREQPTLALGQSGESGPGVLFHDPQPKTRQ